MTNCLPNLKQGTFPQLQYLCSVIKPKSSGQQLWCCVEISSPANTSRLYTEDRCTGGSAVGDLYWTDCEVGRLQHVVFVIEVCDVLSEAVYVSCHLMSLFDVSFHCSPCLVCQCSLMSVSHSDRFIYVLTTVMFFCTRKPGDASAKRYIREFKVSCTLVTVVNILQPDYLHSLSSVFR